MSKKKLTFHMFRVYILYLTGSCWHLDLKIHLEQVECNDA